MDAVHIKWSETFFIWTALILLSAFILISVWVQLFGMPNRRSYFNALPGSLTPGQAMRRTRDLRFRPGVLPQPMHVSTTLVPPTAPFSRNRTKGSWSELVDSDCASLRSEKQMTAGDFACQCDLPGFLAPRRLRRHRRVDSYWTF